MGMAMNGTMMYKSDAEVDDYMAKTGKNGLNAKWLRVQFNWDDIANNKDVLDWTRWDKLVTKAEANGIKVLGIIFGTPTWAQPAGGCNAPFNVLCSPISPADYGNFAGTISTRYNGKNGHGTVAAWEIWNEPNCGALLPIDPAKYTQMIKAAYAPIKAGNPAAPVLAGGSCPTPSDGHNIEPRDWLDAMYDNGAKGYFDALAVHPYCWSGDWDQANPCPGVEGGWSLWAAMYKDFPSPNGTTSKDGRSLRTIVRANGQPDLPFWLTEFGSPDKGDSSQPFLTEANAQRTMKDGYAWLTAQPRQDWYGPVFWYEYQDRTGVSAEVENHFGIYRADGTIKPIGAIYKNLSTTGNP
jgi:hypothetical protein